VAIYARPRTRRLEFRLPDDRRVSWEVPLPGLIWLGVGTSYWTWAVKSRPPFDPTRTRLWAAPLPNVNTDGQICPGTTPFPECSTQSIVKAFELFLASAFNDHLVKGKAASEPEDVLKLLERLQGQPRFPSRELRPAHHPGKLGDLEEMKWKN